MNTACDVPATSLKVSASWVGMPKRRNAKGEQRADKVGAQHVEGEQRPGRAPASGQGVRPSTIVIGALPRHHVSWMLAKSYTLFGRSAESDQEITVNNCDECL